VREVGEMASTLTRNATVAAKSSRASLKSAREASRSVGDVRGKVEAVEELEETLNVLIEEQTKILGRVQAEFRTLRYQTQYDVESDEQVRLPSRNHLFRITIYAGEKLASTGPGARGAAASLLQALVDGAGFKTEGIKFVGQGLGDEGPSGRCEVLYYSPAAWDQAMCVQILLRSKGWTGWGTKGLPEDGGDGPPESPRLLHNPARQRDVQVMLAGCVPNGEEEDVKCDIETLAKKAAEFRNENDDSRRAARP
jgi:hypothetical protein